jgi:hypothetical protein
MNGQQMAPEGDGIGGRRTRRSLLAACPPGASRGEQHLFCGGSNLIACLSIPMKSYGAVAIPVEYERVTERPRTPYLSPIRFTN